MSCLRSLVTIILLQCVIKVLTEPHKRHHKSNALHSDRHTGHEVHIRHKMHGGHRAIKHAVAAGAQRETVPTPVQDFVLVSGSPLFHERPRADSRPNATVATMQEAKDANQTIVMVQGQGQPTQNSQLKQGSGSLTDNHGAGLVHGNGTLQQPLQQSTFSSKPSPEFVQELAQKIKESLDKGKEHGKTENGTQSSAPAVSITLQNPGKANASNGMVIGLENEPLTNTVQGKPTGQDASVKVAKILVNGQNISSSSFALNGQKGNQTNTTTAADLWPEEKNKKPSAGNFPFNVPGIRNGANETNDNKGMEATNQMKEKDKKLGLLENLGPNCHWKTSKGANGALVTSVACSGEFRRPEGGKGGFDEAKKPQQQSSKQLTTGNASVSETGGGEKEIQMQSDEEFEMEALATTNAFRKIHRALPIKVNQNLNLEAKKYAEKIAGMGSLQHDYEAVKHLDEGENLAMGCKQYGVPLTAKEAITNWYNEVCSYDFDRGEFSMSTGHFTQVVWADSHEFGIGRAPGRQNGMPCVFVVGRFRPSGNYKEEYKKNVFKGTFDPSYCDKIRDKKLL